MLESLRAQSPEKLTDSEFDNLEKKIERTATCLRSAGWSDSDTQSALQMDLFDVFERRFAACPYEQERARRLIRQFCTKMEGEAFHVTFGNPRQRVPLDGVPNVSIEATFRHFRRGLEKLSHLGIPVRGFAFFELQECIPLKGRPFIEPHWHAILWGASGKELRSAFALKVPRSVQGRRPGRRRARNVRLVYDLPGAFDYVSKLHPTRRVQYLKKSGKLGWNAQRADSLDDPFVQTWTDFFARHRVSEVLTAIEDELRDLRLADRWELAPPFRQRQMGRSQGRLRWHQRG